MQKHFSHTIVALSIILSMFSSSPAYAAQSTTRQSDRANNPSVGSTTLLRGQNPLVAALSCPETTSIAATIFALCATPMVNTTNKQSWLDQSGASLHFAAYEGSSAAASSNGPQFSTPRNAYLFDGVNDYFSRPLVTNSKSNVSLQATFNTTDASKLGQLIAYNGSDVYQNGYGLAVNSDRTSNNRLWVLYGGILWYDTGFTITSNAWYNTVMVISGTSLKVYVDGSLVYNVTTASTPNTPTLKTEIGRNDYSNGIRYFQGAISSVTLYNAALTQAQITTLYNGITTKPTTTRFYTPTTTATRTNTSTSTPSVTRTGTNTITPTITRTGTNTITPSITRTGTRTITPSMTKTDTSTTTPTRSNTPTATNTVVIAAPTQPRPIIGDSGQIVTWGDNAPYKLNFIPNGTNSGIAQVAIGAHHALAVTSAGSVIGWGTNMKGELTIPPLTDVVQVAVGLNHSVALKSTGEVVMWGDPAARTPPIVCWVWFGCVEDPSSKFNITQIATGDRHTIVLRNDGRVFVYGDSSQRTVPAIVTSKYIVGIAAGADSSFALSSDGAVYQWGKSMVLPVRIAGSIMRIFATGNLFGALRSDGELNLFGPAVNNLTLSGSAVSVSSATSGCPCVKIPNMDGLQNINVTKWGVILARRARQPIAFAYNGSSVPTTLAVNTYQISTNPSHDIGVGVAPVDSQLLIPTATPVTGLTLRGAEILNTPGYLRVWGSDSLVTGAAIPAEAQDALLQVVAGFRHMTVLRSDGAVVSWGDNRFQQRNVPTDLQQARPLTDTLRVVALASGANHTLALRSNGTVVAWGNNDAGQTTVPAGLTNVIQITAGVRHSVALLSDGTVRSWGDNSFGQLTQPLLGGVAKIAAAGWHTIALRRDNTVIAWGRNSSGQTEISNFTNVVDVAASSANSILLLATGQVIVVGQNDDAQRLVPTGYYQQIGAGDMHILAITNNTQVKGWGNNGNGQVSIPTALWNPFQITGGARFSAALVQGAQAPNPTSTPPAPTAPVMPILANAQVPPSYAQIITIADGVASSIDTFNKSGVAIAPGISATLDNTGTVTTNRQSNALLCNIPSAYATQNYQVVLGTYGMVLGLNRTVHAWAFCQNNEATNPIDITNSIPVAFQKNVAEIAVRGTHMLILTVDGRIWSNQVNIPQMTNITHIAAGRNFAAILLGNGTVQVFANTNPDGVKNIPTNAINITDIAAGDYHIIALRNNGQVYSWGANQHDNGQADVPYAATQGNVVAISAGEQQSIVLLNSGDAVAWGDYPANTIDALDDVNRLHQMTGISTGNRQIALLIDDTQGTTITPVPSVTRLVVPTMTPRANDAQFIANQIAWYTMADFSQPQEFNRVPQIYNSGLTAKQSSVYLGNDANRAIDGNTSGYWDDLSIIHTDESENPWWQVDLGSIRDIRNITVYNRLDECCIQRLDTAVVFLTNTDLGTSTNMADNKTTAVTWKSLVCDNQTACGTPAGASEIATFPAGTKARYVRIQLDTTGFLNLAEVVVTGNPVTFTCGSPQACPTLNTSDTPTLAFNNSRSTELISSNAINLNGVPFTIRARMRRDSLNRPDVIASLGNPSGVRQYLVMGVDKENRPYCSFYGDDLRSTSWYVDQEWHNYACSYDPSSRIRTLWRDAQIIGQDIVRGAFTPPAASLIIGRRYDNMAGLTGSIQNLDIVNHVLTQVDLTTFDTINDLQKIIGLVIDTQLQSIAPNKSITRCGSNGNICPIWGTATAPDPIHDGTMAIFTGTQSLEIDKPVTPNGFSIGYWARSTPTDDEQIIATYLNNNLSGMIMGNYLTNGTVPPSCVWKTANTDGTYNTDQLNTSIADPSNWHHYMCTYDAINGTLAYYVDGTLIGQIPVNPQTINGPLTIGNQPYTGNYRGWLDDLMIYDGAVSAAGVAYIYNSTNPPASREIPSATPCDSPDVCPSPTASLTFTATPTASPTPTVAYSKTPLPATATATMPGITPYTVTKTLTNTNTPTKSPTTTKTSTITLTPTLPSATPYFSPTLSATNTGTPRSSTQTMLARRSPTFYAQTQIALVVTNTPSKTATATPTTAYPIPATGTSTRTAYPLPASRTRTP